MTREKWWQLTHLAVFAVIGLAIWICFHSTLSAALLAWDDDKNIIKNPWLLNGEPWKLWLQTYYNLYIPVPYMVWGLLDLDSPRQFHAANLVLHVANSWLTYLLLLGTVQTPLRSWRIRASALAGALCFCVHPLQVGAVAWVSGLRDLLSVFFALLCLLTFTSEEGAGGRGRRAFAFFCYVFALLSKPTAAALPVILLAWQCLVDENASPSCSKVGKEHCEIKRPTAMRILRQTAHWYLIAAADVVIARLSQGPWIADHVPLWQRPLVALDSLGFYLAKVVWPVDLKADYGRTPYWLMTHLAESFLWLPILVLAAFMVWRRRIDINVKRGVLVASLWLLPVLGLVSFAYQNISTVADHYMYGSMFGIALVIFAFLTRLIAKLRAGIVRAAVIGFPVVIVIGSWAYISKARAAVWHDDRSFFTAMLQQNSTSFEAVNALCDFEARSLRFGEALKYADQALHLQPDNPLAIANKGVLLYNLGRYREAQSLLEGYLSRSRADHPEVALLLDRLELPLGLAYASTGDWLKSFTVLCEAHQVKPSDREIERNLRSAEIRVSRHCE